MTHAKTIPVLQVWAFRLAIVLLAVCACMTGAAGWEMYDGHTGKQFAAALMFAVVTFGAAILLPFVEQAWRTGAYVTCAGLVFGWAICTVGEYAGHLMVIGGGRSVNVQEAQLQSTRWEDQRKIVSDLERQIAMLEAKHDFSKPSDSPESFDGRIADARAKIAYETSRGGCKGRCEDWRTVLGKLESEQSISKDRAATLIQLDDLKKQLAEARRVAGATQKGTSIAQTQTDNIARVLFVNMKPGQTAQEKANFAFELFQALLYTVLPMTFIFCALKDWSNVSPSGGFGRMVASLGALAKGEKLPEGKAAPANDAHPDIIRSSNVGTASAPVFNLTIPQTAPQKSFSIEALTINDLLRKPRVA